jgi:N-acyl-D-amino-acid deacylase
MSTGLIYPPSVYAETEEIIELSKIVANYSGIYASHIRGEGETLLEAIEEAGEIGEKSGTPVQIAHFKASGKPNWGMTKDSLALVKKYRNMGIDITFDQYPYIAGSTGLKSLFPHWAHEGGAEKMIKRLKDPKIREKMRDQLRPDKEWNQIMVAYAKNHPKYNGKNIEEIAELENKDPYDSVCDLLIAENNQVQIVSFGMDEEDVRRVMRSPFGMVGSDGSAISPDGILGQGNPHPRYYGTFPRVLGYYVREEVLSLPEAVRKMTSAPAQKLGIKDRGLLRQGYKADLVIFDPDNIKDKATFTNPHQYPSGIPFVIVNGKIVVEKGEHTGALPGKTLRKQKSF